MKTKLIPLVILAGMAGQILADPLAFDFKDPKGVNNAVFKLDAPLEAINGSASGISGTITFDPAAPAGTTGKIVVDAKSLTVPNPMMKDHLLGAQWLDVEKNPEITFALKQLKNVATKGNETVAVAEGTFTLKGTSKDLNVPVKLTYLKDKLSQRVPNLKGDLLVVRANFAIKRSDFGINPGAPQDKVSDEIQVTLSLAGAAAQP